jgi:hypothetical protein
MSAETNAKRSLSRFLRIHPMENMSEMVKEVDDAPVPYEEVCADLVVPKVPRSWDAAGHERCGWVEWLVLNTA